jgi:rod shape determining protein RodA
MPWKGSLFIKFMREEKLLQRIDWQIIGLYAFLVMLGWLNIYAVNYEPGVSKSILDPSIPSGRQLIWILSSVLIIIFIMAFDLRIYNSLAFFFYGGVILVLIFVSFGGKEVAGSRSWIGIGSFGIQPSEFAKFATALAVAKYLSITSKPFNNIKSQALLFFIIGLPALLIIIQGDTGTALVYSVFVIVFFREGMSPLLVVLGIISVTLFVFTLFIDQIYLLIGLTILSVLLVGLNTRNRKKVFQIVGYTVVVAAFIMSTDFVVSDILKPHQQDRIKALINPSADPLGFGWNVTQSKIAIGSGGLFGKGFLNGTQTKLDFVPEQTTDFIFCTIGEEHGWVGSLILIVGFTFLIIRIITVAEQQKSRFSRIYGYSVALIIFFHFAVNIGMTIGLFPVIGIPLPFFSYGGSSLWGFTILLFIFLKLDAHKMQILERRVRA